tara:strand:+ start:5541 stop:5702 length:162 start_codon:yes stop_codon:yes gene_type:complete
MNIYTLNCKYYSKEFNSINDLITDITTSGMDPNYEILKNGLKIGEKAINYIVF